MDHEVDTRICNLEDILIQKAYEQDVDTVDTHEMGEVIDMVKDIAEIKRNHYEACYYKSVVEAMNEYGNDRAVENPYWDGKYDKAYNKYKSVRRHYTESHSQDDKMKMDQHANEHIDLIIETVKDIWNDADPNLRQQMKDRMTNLLNEMV